MAFHCFLTRLPTDARAIPESGSSDPMASPQWGFYGLGSRLGSNEKIEMTLSTSKRGWVKANGAHLHFLPWLYSTRGGLGPFVGWPLNPGLLILGWVAQAPEPHGVIRGRLDFMRHPILGFHNQRG